MKELSLNKPLALAFLMGLGSSAFGLDTNSSSTDYFSIEGSAEVFNKFGFNGKGESPTDSYGYVLGEINGIYTYKNLQIKIGGTAAGLTYDSTRYSYGAGNSASDAGGFVNQAYNYVGYYAGYSGTGSATSNNTRNFFIHNAQIAFDNQKLQMQAGRFYKNDGIYLDSYIEGVSVSGNLGGFYANISGISSMALFGDGFFWDYSQTFAPKGLLSAKVGYQNSFLDASVFAYYGIEEYSAPGLDVQAKFGTVSKITSITRLNVVFPIYDGHLSYLGGSLLEGLYSDLGFTSSILVREDIEFGKHYGIGVGIYKNIGASNARFGLYGSPLGVNIWDNSVFVLGPSLNGIVAPDALSALIFLKAQYENLAKFAKNLELNLDGRYTNAPSVEEYSLKFSAILSLTQRIDFEFIANYYTSIAYNAVWGSDNATIDRSYIMTKINFKI